MKYIFLCALLFTLVTSSLEAGAQTRPRPRAASDGIFGAKTAAVVAVSIAVAAAATGIALIATNSSTSHSH